MTLIVESWLAGRHVRPETAPVVLADLIDALDAADPSHLSRNDPPAVDVAERQAAVLILLATDGSAGPDVLLQERASALRDHAGEISFPGGRREPDDAGVVETALREAVEETGIDPAGVDALSVLPRLQIVPSRFDVTGILAHWRAPSAVAPQDQAETAATMRIPLRRLVEPANRLCLETSSGWRGPAFRIDGHLIWGYTGEIIATIIHLGGWERPWENAGRPHQRDA
jgi:8-oxo-dGTP pyrophosphatase MutT (NUDIX family)